MAIHKVCKSLSIPTPPLGYWAKVRAGKQVEKPPLLKSDISKKTGVHTSRPLMEVGNDTTLSFLDEEDRAIVLTVAAQILLPQENERLHRVIVTQRKAFTAWKKEQKKDRNNRQSPPLDLFNHIDEISIPRVCRIIDALAKAMEPLGCKLTDTLAFIVNGETVSLTFSEMKDKVPHVITKEENRALMEYEDERRRYSYAYKPKIPQYDYQYNGRLNCKIDEKKSFHDCKSYQLEERLGDILLEIYVAAERLKQERLAREEAERKRREEELQKEERRKRYNQKVSQTMALVNKAADYDTACKIRAFISAYQAAHPEKDLSTWVAWANEKADWYDPTVAKEDEFLGKRDHAQNEDKKTLQYKGYWW